jgi:hypothetical protein
LFSAISETAREAAAIVMSASDTNRVDPLSPAQWNGRDFLFSPLAYRNTHSGEAVDGRLVSDAPMF